VSLISTDLGGKMSIKIITDSACDFQIGDADKLGVIVLPLRTFFGEEEYLDGVTLGHDEFFQKLIETDVFPKTSQIPPLEFEEAYKKIKENSDTAICITLSSKLSGTYQSARIAAEDYEDCISVVDSENVCVGQQILVRMAVKLVNEGKTQQEIVDILECEKKKVRLIALLDTLEYLKRGGRVSAVVAAAANVLSIKPVIAIENGEVAVIGKARGSKAANNKLTELIEKEGGICFDKPYALAYSGLSDNLLQKYIADFSYIYEGRTDELPINSIGCVIGTHAGPGAIAVAFFVE
jgi:DegV family protein with EDD domain